MNSSTIIKQQLIPLHSGKSTTLRFVIPSDAEKEIGFLLFPALGVKAKYYDPLLMALAAKGYQVAVVDLHGQGDSSLKASRTVDFGYREILDEDIPCAIRTAKDLFSLPLIILGHSLGGQMASLYLGQSQDNIKGLILCTSCSVYYKGWNGMSRYRVLIGTQFCMILSKCFGYFPGNLVGFGGITGKRLIHDWAYQARSGKYRVSGSDKPWEADLKQVDIPILALSLKKDTLAPKEAVAHLCQKMDQAPITQICLDARTLNHFTWVKAPDAFLQVINKWMEETFFIKN